jgi:hypothetical protein
VHFHCDIDFDPFTYLRENNKTYGSFLSCLSHWMRNSIPFLSGFTLAMYDYGPTMESLWPTVKGIIAPSLQASDPRAHRPNPVQTS